MNQEWHEINKITKNPSIDERIRWHQDHARNCNCRPIPVNLLVEMKKKGLIK